MIGLHVKLLLTKYLVTYRNYLRLEIVVTCEYHFQYELLY